MEATERGGAHSDVAGSGVGVGVRPYGKLVAKTIGVMEDTFYRWRKAHSGLRTDQEKRFKNLEWENARLKRLLTDAELDKSILREAAGVVFLRSVGSTTEHRAHSHDAQGELTVGLYRALGREQEAGLSTVLRRRAGNPAVQAAASEERAGP